jgi:hypothetical protein
MGFVTMSGTSQNAAAVDRSRDPLIRMALLAAEAGALALVAMAVLQLAPVGMRERLERWLRLK